MKKVYKVLLGILAIVLIGVALTGTYVKVFLPNINEPVDITIQQTPERIERGRYLANNVAVCMDCHSSRDWTEFAGPLLTSERLLLSKTTRQNVSWIFH